MCVYSCSTVCPVRKPYPRWKTLELGTQKSFILSKNMVGDCAEERGWEVFTEKLRFEPRSLGLKGLGQRGKEVKGIPGGGKGWRNGPGTGKWCLEEWQAGRHSVYSSLCHIPKRRGSDPKTALVKHFSGKLRPVCHFSFEHLESL